MELLISLLVFLLIVVVAVYLASMIPDPRLALIAKAVILAIALIYLLMYYLPHPLLHRG